MVLICGSVAKKQNMGWFPKFRRRKNQPNLKGGYSMYWDNDSMQVVRDVAEGKTNKYRASLIIGKHVRTIERKVRAYKTKGVQCFVHGNKGKVPSNKTDFEKIFEFIQKYDMSDCNFTELSRLLHEYGHITISTSCLRKRLFANGVLSVKCKRKTRKKLRAILRELEKQQAITQDNLETLSGLDQEEVTGAWHHPTKSRCKYFGERLEMDASTHVWVKGLGKCTLHVCIDDASGFLVGLWLEQEETLHGYYRLLEQVLAKYGIPLSLRTDKRTVFIYNRKGGSLPEKDTMTQFAYACKCFGIELKSDSDPDFKPKVERANQTLQGMIPFRNTMEKITTFEEANEYLQSKFIPYFNSKFGYGHDFVDGHRRPIGSVFQECSAEQIRNTLAVLCERTVNKGCSISLDKTYMALLNEKGQRITLPYHTKVTVARLLDGSLFATTKDDRCYALEPIPERHAFSPEMDTEDMKPKEKAKRPKMPASHPWSFEKQKKFRESDALMKRLEPLYKSPHESRYA